MYACVALLLLPTPPGKRLLLLHCNATAACRDVVPVGCPVSRSLCWSPNPESVGLQQAPGGGCNDTVAFKFTQDANRTWYNHVVTMYGLEPATVYYYQIFFHAWKSIQYHFRSQVVRCTCFRVTACTSSCNVTDVHSANDSRSPPFFFCGDACKAGQIADSR